MEQDSQEKEAFTNPCESKFYGYFFSFWALFFVFFSFLLLHLVVHDKVLLQSLVQYISNSFHSIHFFLFL